MFSFADLSSVSPSDPLVLAGTSVVSEVGWLPHILETTSHKEPLISTKIFFSEYRNSSQVKPKLARFKSNIKEIFIKENFFHFNLFSRIIDINDLKHDLNIKTFDYIKKNRKQDVVNT